MASSKLDDNGELFLNGDTGISAGVKNELASIKGEPKLIPLFNQVNGPGNNATYSIVKFVGVRLMQVKLTGKTDINPWFACLFQRRPLPTTNPSLSSWLLPDVE